MEKKVDSIKLWIDYKDELVLAGAIKEQPDIEGMSEFFDEDDISSIEYESSSEEEPKKAIKKVKGKGKKKGKKKKKKAEKKPNSKSKSPDLI